MPFDARACPAQRARRPPTHGGVAHRRGYRGTMPPRADLEGMANVPQDSRHLRAP